VSERLQILKVNKSTTDTSVPNLSKFLDKNRKPLVSRPPLIQTKLTINQPGDEYEKEADRVAEQVMRMPEPESVSQSQVNSRPEEMSIQNANRCPKKDIQQKEDDGKEERIIQMKQGSPLHSAGSQPIVPPTIREVLSSPGLPLDPAIRAYMEPRFGHDFSRVRVHSGLAAEQSARDVNAQAYTAGHDIVFGAGRLSTVTYEGRRLIAHELMHVVQQRDRGQAIQRQPTSPTVDDLTNAISNHDLGRVQQLISSGVDVNALDKNGMTPLTQATKDGDLQIMELLINNSTKVDGRNNDRETPLIIAATIGNQQAAEILLKNNAWVNAQDLQHRGPLFLSVQNNDLKMVNFFLQNGADVDLTADWGRTSLMEAATKGYQNIMKALIQNGAKVNKEDANNRTALMEAASTGNPKSVKLLLDENADPNKVDKFGRTAIMDASEFGSAQATKELLKAKASVNVQDQDGRTALMEAAKKGKHNIVKVIIQNSNTDVNLKDNKGETALIEAAKSGDVDTLKAILQSKVKVDLNMQDNNGKTALMEAASSGKPGMVKTLVQKTPKPDLNMQDLDGKTALILAVESGDVEGIKALVQSGVKLDITDKHGNTALSAAQSILFQGGPDTQKNFGEIVKILQKTPHKRIQPFSGQSNGRIDAASANVDQALSSQGRPLEPVVRKDMEQHLGYDFSRVRIHSDAVAEQSARNLNAQAYTVGNDIVFGAGQYAPGAHQGRRMIAHELTHVLQQQGNSDGR
jgi:ankyrin repeat protein